MLIICKKQNQINAMLHNIRFANIYSQKPEPLLNKKPFPSGRGRKGKAIKPHLT